MFITTIDKLKTLKYKAEVEKETGAAMIFAILLLMLMLFVSVMLATTATTQAGVAREQTLRESYLAAANDGIDYLLATANRDANVMENYRGASKALTSSVRNGQYSVNGIQYKVWTEQVATTGSTLSYYVYSTGYNSTVGINKGVTLRATFESTTVDSATYVSGDTLEYRVNPDNTWGLGILGTSGASWSGTSKLYTYESGRQGFIPTGTSTSGSSISTNGLVTLGTTSTGVKSVVSNVPSSTTGCTPTANCGGVNLQYRGNVLSLANVATDVNTACPLATYPAWRSSTSGSVMNFPATNRCYGSIIIDSPTTVSGAFTENSPLKLYVKGSVSITGSGTLNATGSPLKLQVFSTGGNFDMSAGKANMLYASSNATCSVNGTSVYFGGLSCATVNASGSALVYYDSSAKGIKTTGATIWNKVYIEEV